MTAPVFLFHIALVLYLQGIHKNFCLLLRVQKMPATVSSVHAFHNHRMSAAS